MGAGNGLSKFLTWFYDDDFESHILVNSSFVKNLPDDYQHEIINRQGFSTQDWTLSELIKQVELLMLTLDKGKGRTGSRNATKQGQASPSTQHTIAKATHSKSTFKSNNGLSKFLTS